MINKELKEYIDVIIMKNYEFNDKGHDIYHVNSVLQYAEAIAKNYPEINKDNLYIAVIYHDVCCHIDRKYHNELAYEFVKNDQMLRKFLSEEDIEEIAIAVLEHRSKTPSTTLMSKILSDADKADACRLDRMIYRAWYYGKYYFPGTPEEELIVRCHKTQNKRYGKNAYFRFNLPDTVNIVKEDLEFSKKCLEDYENLFLPYTHNLIKQGVLK